MAKKPLIDYDSDYDSDDSSSLKSPELAVKQETTLPKLPGSFFTAFTTPPRMDEIPELHEGKSRTIPHQDGKWPTHIFIGWRPDPSVWPQLQSIVSQYVGVHSLVYSDLGAIQPLHVSLSDTIMLETKHREELPEILKKALQEHFNGVAAAPLCLTVQGSVVWLTNDSNSRSFLALPLSTESSELLKPVVQRINSILTSLGYSSELMPDYKFHVSLGWVPSISDVNKQLVASDKDGSCDRQFSIPLSTSVTIGRDTTLICGKPL